MYGQDFILAFVLIAIGFLLLGVEIVFPSGVCFALSILALLAGIVLAFLKDAKIGWLTFAGVVVAFACMVGLIRYCWTKTSFGRNMVLGAPEEDTTLAYMPANRELERLVGRLGKAEGALRPSGIALFDGRRVDCITEGLMVEAGQNVRCVSVQAGRVIVRPVREAPEIDLEKPLFE
jgi:membrane-bound serine protease (ClpP class)